MKLSFHCNIPAPSRSLRVRDRHGPDGDGRQALFVQKYGEPVQEVDGAVLTRDTDDGAEALWRCTFTYPERRTMEAIDSSWSDREDVFERVKDGTRWTVTSTPSLVPSTDWCSGSTSSPSASTGWAFLCSHPWCSTSRRKAREAAESGEEPPVVEE